MPDFRCKKKTSDTSDWWSGAHPNRPPVAPPGCFALPGVKQSTGSHTPWAPRRRDHPFGKKHRKNVVKGKIYLHRNHLWKLGNGYISHLGKRKIIFKMPFWGGYVSSLEGNMKMARVDLFFIRVSHVSTKYVASFFKQKTNTTKKTRVVSTRNSHTRACASKATVPGNWDESNESLWFLCARF